MNIEFYGKDNLGNAIEASLSSSTVMGISEKILQNFSSTLNLENIYSNFVDSTFKLYDSIDVNDLQLKSEYATLKTEGFTSRQTREKWYSKKSLFEQSHNNRVKKFASLERSCEGLRGN